jgi:glycosyltransferase involved in cell wall biosynthesis
MRILFVKDVLAWPRWAGHDVHAYHLMKALSEAGHAVALVTIVDPSVDALEGLSLAYRGVLTPDNDRPSPLLGRSTWLQNRFASFWGVGREHQSALSDHVRTFEPDALVAVGLNALPYLLNFQGVVRIWYAADEWVVHHLSQVRWRDVASWVNIRDAVLKGLYERTFASVVDRTWVVSEAEVRPMQLLAGMQTVDVLPNGVDTGYYRPAAAKELPQSAIFWGRLDFGPNIQALQWFCLNIWPAVRRVAPEARFTIIGFNAGKAVQRLAGRNGISLIPNLRDLRAEVARHQVAVLPLFSGGGIKNKLLEAASLAKPILCTTRAAMGLRTATSSPPLIRVTRPAEWVEHLLALWNDDSQRHRLGEQARTWVQTHHSWAATAHEAAASVRDGLARRVDDASERVATSRATAARTEHAVRPRQALESCFSTSGDIVIAVPKAHRLKDIYECGKTFLANGRPPQIGIIVKVSEGRGMLRRLVSLFTLRRRLSVAARVLHAAGGQLRVEYFGVFPSIDDPIVVFELSTAASSYASVNLLSGPRTGLRSFALRTITWWTGCDPVADAVLALTRRS